MDAESGIELTEATVFGRHFVDLPGLVADLITLEKEGAIYSHFWDDEAEVFRYYQVAFLPREIYQYVDAHVAKQQFDTALSGGATFDEALLAIDNRDIAERVRAYGDNGHSKLRDGTFVDIRGCAATFYPPEIEALVCGLRPDRYQLLPELQALDKPSLIIQMVDFFPVIARFMGRRGNGRPPFEIENEYDVQHLLFVVVRAVFEDARLEDWTPKHAGASKRIDIVVPSAETVLETKKVRDGAHARTVADELKVDIESYHAHPSCKRLVALVYDPDHHLTDPAALMKELSGLRVKRASRFEVVVLVRP
jgi:REase_DpnII-MboI